MSWFIIQILLILFEIAWLCRISLLQKLFGSYVAIASNVPGCNDVIIDGYNGFLFKSRDSVSLKNIMEKVLLLDKETLYEMGVNSRKNVEEKFSINQVIKIYKKEINKILVK